MLFNLLVLLVILLATAYFASQGVLSATLALVTGAFASILAMGLFEPLQGTVQGHWPGLARGVTFLVIYAVTFFVLRFGADLLIKKNIKLSNKRMDNLAGGVVGFFAALVIVGSCVLGLEMFPVHTTILGLGGDQEYSTDARMQGGEQGQVVPDEGLSMWPQRFTLALWNGASGRSLGGDKQFGWVHPDLPLESYGYRNVVEYGSNSTVPQELLDTSRFKAECYVSDGADLLKNCNIPEGKQALVVRIRVKKGVTNPVVSSDIDNWFRITPTQLRVVTNKDQRYPIGHLRNESSAPVAGPAYAFEATPLDTGHLIDDYVAEQVVEDWVFQIDKDEQPQFLEVKELARAEFPEKLSPKPFAPLVAAEYPHRDYRKNHGSVAVTVWGDDAGTHPLKDVKLVLVTTAVKITDIQSSLTKANSHIEDVLNQANDGTEPWTSALGKPGVPAKQTFISSHRIVTQANTEQVIRWEEFVPVLMLGTITPDGAQNVNAGPVRFQDTVEPLLKDIIRASGVSDAAGKVTLEDIAPGDYCLIGATKSDSGEFCVWAHSIKVEKKTQALVSLKPGAANFLLAPPK